MTAGAFENVTDATPCAICGGPDWCSRSKDGAISLCRRVHRPDGLARDDKHGVPYYVYASAEALRAARRITPADDVATAVADLAVRDSAYRALLNDLGVSDAHRENLRRRGLTDAIITARGYASLPADAARREGAVRRVLDETGISVLTAVPGFFRRTPDSTIELAGAAGLVIPARALDGKIQGLRIRLDKPPFDASGKPVRKYRWLSAPASEGVVGARAAVAVHIPLHDPSQVTDVRVTEGELKADITTELTKTLTISVPGVGMFAMALPVLRALRATRASIAFDADAATNRAVAGALQRLFVGLAASQGLTASGVETWNAAEGKGIDDVLAAGRGGEIRQRWGYDAAITIAAIAQSSGAALDPVVAATITLANLDERLSRDSQDAFHDDVVTAAATLRSVGAVREYEALAARLKQRSVRLAAWERAVRKREESLAIERERAARAGPFGASNWRFDHLITDDDGAPKRTLANVQSALVHAPEWAGVLAFDAFAQAVVVRAPPPWHEEYAPVGGAPAGVWSDDDDARLVLWAERELGFTISKESARSAVLLAAKHSQTVHPLREYLDGLRWDGIERLPTWLVRYLKSPQPAEYLALVGRWFMISAVRRAFEPGCKADYLIVLQGPQGKQKSTVVATLAVHPEWFASLSCDVGTKDALQILNGKWFVELAELASLSRAEVAKVKQYISDAKDTYRPPYASRPVDVSRQNVFVGTVNEDTYLRDDTGNRRFWPVTVVSVDLDALSRDRDQLWAEAVHRYRAGERSYPVAEDEALLGAEQDARYVPDAWETAIAEWLNATDKEFVTVANVLEGALGRAIGQVTRGDGSRVGVIMKRLGWERSRPSEGNGSRQRGYLRTPTSESGRRQCKI